jgi:hypothetical protein
LKLGCGVGGGGGGGGVAHEIGLEKTILKFRRGR